MAHIYIRTAISHFCTLTCLQRVQILLKHSSRLGLIPKPYWHPSKLVSRVNCSYFVRAYAHVIASVEVKSGAKKTRQDEDNDEDQREDISEEDQESRHSESDADSEDEPKDFDLQECVDMSTPLTSCLR
jgi:hypothetical protein